METTALDSGILRHLGSARPRDSLDLPIDHLPQRVNDFLLSRSIENCSKQTLETYAKRLRAFFEVAGKADLKDVHKADIERWFLHLRETESRRGGKRSPSYIGSCYLALHAFFSWAVEEGVISTSPMKTIKKLKAPKVIKPFLSEEKRPMTHNGLMAATRKLYVRSGVPQLDMHHIFRRTWAWRMLKAGMPAKAVQLIGGWESMSMLERYVAMMDTEDALAMISGD